MVEYIIYAIIALLGIILFVLILPTGKKRTKKNTRFSFSLKAENNKILSFNDPFDGFLIYGGANSGKTKSIGKPLLGEYIRNNFAGFIYDYKDFDLTKTAYHLVKKYNYPYKFYYINFTDMEHTYRVNPISPKAITDENLFLQVIEDLLLAYQEEGTKRDEWFNGALGILKGIAISFYYDYPHLCTIPHIVNFVCSAGSQRITNLLERSHYSRTLGSAFLDAKDSPKTQSSYLSSLTNYLSPLAFNKKISYVLSGDDFDFNLIDPDNPKLISVCNAFQIENVIAPIISLMLSISTRRFTLNNKIPCMYFLDEATTFKISDFEKLPSVLREYLCSFTFITQSAAKIEKRYSKLDRSSIESNLNNQFYGRTKDTEALKNYPIVFGKVERQRISRTKGSSRGGSNQSKTFSTQKEDYYDTSFFTNLMAGQFVGTANANLKKFNLRFKMYQENEESLPLVETVLESEIEEKYFQILNNINII